MKMAKVAAQFIRCERKFPEVKNKSRPRVGLGVESHSADTVFILTHSVLNILGKMLVFVSFLLAVIQ